MKKKFEMVKKMCSLAIVSTFLAGSSWAHEKVIVVPLGCSSNVPAGANISGTDGLKTFTITDGLYGGNKTATANDTDLVEGNIKDEITIFGVEGTLPISSVAKTGLVRCTYYNGSSWQWDDTCSQDTRPPGQDGEVEPGAAWPIPRFSDNIDGTVTDNLTGMVWLKDAHCTTFYSGDVTQSRRNWNNALTSVNQLANGFCGLSDGSSTGDWRLPSLKELRSLIDLAYVYPALSNDAGTGKWTSGADSAFFGVQSERYWSSTTYAGSVINAWRVNFGGGGCVVDWKSTNYFYVWPVRD